MTQILAFPSGEDITEHVLTKQQEAVGDAKQIIYGSLETIINKAKELPQAPVMAVLTIKFADGEQVLHMLPRKIDKIYAERMLRRAAEMALDMADLEEEFGAGFGGFDDGGGDVA